MASAIRIPCCWPECQQRLSTMNILLKHLKNMHGVVDGFGCHYCGFKDPAEQVARSHILQHHQTQEKPYEAAIALAHYCRKKYQDSDPSVRNLDPQAFWGRGQKSKSLDSVLCHLCDSVISPHTTQAAIQHLCSAHYIVIELDPEQIRNYPTCYEPDEYIADVNPPTTSDEDPEILDVDEQDVFGYNQDEDDEYSEDEVDVVEADKEEQAESKTDTQYETAAAPVLRIAEVR
jgi:hypothetical protein